MIDKCMLNENIKAIALTIHLLGTCKKFLATIASSLNFDCMYNFTKF